jgi:ribonucleoside-diphosphate reductase alpha chain
MTGFPFPYVIVASNGQVMRTLHAATLGEHRVAVEAALSALLLDQPAAEPKPAPQPAGASLLTQGEMARQQGYTGDCCSHCQQFRMKQSGHCMVCDACGTTTGCS